MLNLSWTYYTILAIDYHVKSVSNHVSQKLLKFYVARSLLDFIIWLNEDLFQLENVNWHIYSKIAIIAVTKSRIER